MRFDLPDDVPYDLPRKREPANNPARQMEPSPIERHQKRLAEQAGHPRPVDPPRRERTPQPHPHDAEADARSIPHEAIPHDPRPQRDHLQPQAIGLSLRDEEIKALAVVGSFRVVATRDLAETVYDNRPARLERDLAFLRQQGLVRIDSVRPRRDGHRGAVEPIEVVTLTRSGREMARRTSGLPEDQRLYAGLVKPREVEHDTQIYRAYRKEAERIKGRGGRNLRVELDFELKSQIQKAIYAERKANPNRDLNEIKQQVAEQFDLSVVNNTIQIPDARIEYDTDQGPRTGHEDIEVLTAAYRPGHVQGKVQAGFHLYASASDRASLTARVEDDHHLLDNILEL